MSRLATIRPGIFTAVWLASFLLLMALGVWRYTTLTYLLIVVPTAVFTQSWVASVGALASRNEAKIVWPLVLLWVVASTTKAVLYPYHTGNTVLDLVGIAAVLILVWRSALALERASNDQMQAPATAVLKTAALLFFNIIGVWVLRSKIMRVAARDTPEAP